MIARLLVLGCCALLPAAASADDPTKGPLVKEIKLDGVKLDVARGTVRKPSEVTSADELAKLVPDRETQARLAKEINFDRQKLVVFAWAGSGQDRLQATVAENPAGKQVTFLYRAGRTRDLRPHLHVFAVDKKAKWQVADDRGDKP